MNDLASTLPPPVQVLVAAGRHALHGSTPTVPPLTGEDAAALPAYALRHGMVGFLPHVLPALGARSPHLHEDLQRLVHDHALAVLRDITELLTIARHLTRSGIEFAVLKGAVFSAWLYGDAGMRRSVDLDVLVHERTRADAVTALEQIGFVRRIPAAAADAIYASIGAWPLRRAAGGISVDLHWQLSARRFPMPLTANEVLGGIIPVRVGDHRVNAPGPTDAAVLALLHAAKHVWYALESILAIAWLTRRDDIDWPGAHRLLRRAGAVRAPAAGLRLAADLFDTPVPDPFGAEAYSTAVEQLSACARSALVLPPRTFVDRWLERRAHLIACDCLSDRMQYDVRRLIEPSALEWDWLPLPRALTPLYVPLRVIRLMTRIW